MTDASGRPPSPSDPDLAEAFARLAAAATPEDRTAVAQALLNTAEGPLELDGTAEAFADLRGVRLPGARLRRARLAFADLRGADLSESFLAQADLHGAKLEGARLSGADLSHANCAGAEMGEVDLQSALLEEAVLEGASLRFADLHEAVMEGASLVDADLWGAKMSGADLSGAGLRRARIGEAFAAGADFSRADLRDADLIGTDLQGASLLDADLRGANLKQANLSGANLSGTQLQGLDLSSCELAHTRWSDARLDRTRLRQEQLGGAVGEERTGAFDAAARSYMALERNFADLGDAGAASWAYRRKRRMQKEHAGRLALAAWRERRWRAFASAGLRRLSDQLVEWICDYGESVGRVFGTLIAVYLGFLVLYGLTGSVARLDGTVRTITRNPLDLAVFSLEAMTTSGSPSITLQPSDVYALFLSGIQALLGIFLTGLLGFVAGNRIRR